MNRQLNIKLKMIDFWGKAMYKVEDKKVYFTSTESIFPNKNAKTFKEIDNYFENNLDELVIHGANMEDDTLGTNIGKGWKLNIIK